MESVAIGFWTRVGSRYEPAQANGIAHFIEHMLFKGTPTRSSAEISRQIERLGGSLDGFTVEDHTCFHVHGPGDHFEKLLDVLTDMYRFPVFDTRDIEQERNVILEEIAMIRDQPSQLLEDLLSEAAWGSEHPLGRPITGTELTLAGLGRNELLQFFQQAYSPLETVISIAGKIDHESAAAMVHDRVFDMEPEMQRRDFLMVSPPEQGFCFETRDDLEQAQIAIGFRGVSRNHPDRYAMKMLNVLLGENMSSRLFQTLREEAGLCYEVQSDTVTFEDAGMLHLYVALDPENLTEALELIGIVLNSFRDHLVAESDLEEAKSYVIGQSRIGLENTNSQMMWSGESLLAFDEWISPIEVFAGINAVTIEDIQDMARRIFLPAGMAVAGVGPHSVGLELNQWELVS